jgi:hypothetical protein
MLSLERCRKIDPILKDIPDKELEEVLVALYGLGQLALDQIVLNKGFQKSPLVSDKNKYIG